MGVPEDSTQDPAIGQGVHVEGKMECDQGLNLHIVAATDQPSFPHPSSAITPNTALFGPSGQHLSMGLYVLPLSPNDHPTLTQGSPKNRIF